MIICIKNLVFADRIIYKSENIPKKKIKIKYKKIKLVSNY